MPSLSDNIHANGPVFGGRCAFCHSSIELIFKSVALLHKISNNFPIFYCFFCCALPCPEKFNAASCIVQVGMH